MADALRDPAGDLRSAVLTLPGGVNVALFLAEVLLVPERRTAVASVSRWRHVWGIGRGNIVAVEGVTPAAGAPPLVNTSGGRPRRIATRPPFPFCFRPRLPDHAPSRSSGVPDALQQLACAVALARGRPPVRRATLRVRPPQVVGRPAPSRPRRCRSR